MPSCRFRLFGVLILALGLSRQMQTAERVHLRFVFDVHAADQTPAESSQDRCVQAIQTKLFCMSLARLARTWFQCTSLARPGMKPITPKTYQTGQAEEGRERRQRLGWEYAMAHSTQLKSSACSGGRIVS